VTGLAKEPPVDRMQWPGVARSLHDEGLRVFGVAEHTAFLEQMDGEHLVPLRPEVGGHQERGERPPEVGRETLDGLIAQRHR
jgi:hypothetical protein